MIEIKKVIELSDAYDSLPQDTDETHYNHDADMDAIVSDYYNYSLSEAI